jgi:hypothetical protein
VALPVAAFTGVVILLFEATVALAGGVAATGVGVLEAVLVETVAATGAVVLALLEEVAVCVRSIVPPLGDTKLATESVALGTAAALLEPPLPQAARASVVSVHRIALRATSVKTFIGHYPG